MTREATRAGMGALVEALAAAALAERWPHASRSAVLWRSRLGRRLPKLGRRFPNLDNGFRGLGGGFELHAGALPRVWAGEWR